MDHSSPNMRLRTSTDTSSEEAPSGKTAFRIVDIIVQSASLNHFLEELEFRSSSAAKSSQSRSQPARSSHRHLLLERHPPLPTPSPTAAHAQATTDTLIRVVMAFVVSPALPRRPPTRSTHQAAVMCAQHTPELRKFTRRAVLAAVASATGSILAASVASSQTSELQYSRVKAGEGPAAEIGDLVGIRFKGMYNGVVFDNLFEDKTPYFYRAGSGIILKGLDETVLHMKVGDVYDVSIPGDLAFGSKGRRASAGKPSIPPNATVSYTIELTTIPGKENELLESLDDADIE